MNLLNAAITTAVSAALSPVLQFRRQSLDKPRSVVAQANFTYGSGGTTATAWLQTSVDGGATWIDVVNWAFTTSSLRALANLSSLTPITTIYTATDGTLSSNTCKDGIIGEKWRVKYTTTGTYAGGTQLLVDVSPGGMMP
jgi:hypothetical protein